jgi:glycosyltransferase involved in cell wall biosynthesis
MKLCHIVPSLEQQHGGPSKSVRALCAAIAALPQRVELLATAPDAPPGGSPQDEGALRIRVFRRDWPRRICVSHGMRRALEATTVDVVHHHALWLRTLHYAHLRARQGAKLVVSPRGMMGPWAWQHRRWRKQLSRFVIHPGALEAVDGWHATSEQEAQEIRGLGFTQPICVAANGVAAPAANELAAARAHWLAACPAAAERPVALFYSRFHAKKRVLELIDLWGRHGPRDWLLLLVGIPQDYTPDQLERHAATVAPSGSIVAFDGRDHPPPYAVASLFLLPSHNENFGLVIAEAMASSIPVVVTDATPWTELNRIAAGWCVPWTQFAETVASATREGPERLRTRGAIAREWVLREFAWDRSARKLAAFYHALQENKA